MDLQYFSKELISNPIMIAGKVVEWETLDGNRGVLEIDPEHQPDLVAGLNAAAAKHRGGIIKITADEYRKKKALHPFNPSAPRLKKDMLRALPPSIRPAVFNPVAAVAGNRPTPLAAKPTPPVQQTAPAPQNGEAQIALNQEPPKFRPTTRRISRREAVGEGD